jgi:glycosyltransferase involved in cell wall biosynthesis
MLSQPKISVIITCFNQGKYLRDSLGSLKNQDWENWECLIIDDGSKDNSLVIAQELAKNDSHIQVVSQPNAGVSSARNKGISLATGDYVQFLDADDKLASGKWKRQVQILHEFPQVDLVYGPSRYFFDSIPNELFPLHPNGAIPGDLTWQDSHQVEMILKHNICTNSAPLMRIKVVERVKFRKVIYEDWIFNLESALNGFKFHFDSSQDSLSLVRMTQSSQMVIHTNQVAKMEVFKSLQWRLVKESGYPLDRRFIDLPEESLSGKIKAWVRQLAPPLVYSFAARLKNG